MGPPLAYRLFGESSTLGRDGRYSQHFALLAEGGNWQCSLYQ